MMQPAPSVRLVIQYRKKFLSTLLQVGMEEAETVAHDFSKAQAKSNSDYEQL